MSLLFSVLLLSIIFHMQNCVIIRHVDVDVSKKGNENGIEYVLNKYLKPLRRLTDELPNHSVEMQIEILDQSVSPRAVTVPQPRFYRVVNGWPKRKVIRRQAETEAPETAAPTTTTAATTTMTVATTPSDPMKRPVYMEDLIKALDDLEKRLEKKLLALATTTTTAAPCAVNGLKHPRTVQNIDELLHILRKAVHVEKHVPKPNDDADLDWVQVKIPKYRD